jgi:hypothetical protein
MSELVANCPRCGAREITFDLIAQLPLYIQYDWQYWYEVFCICRRCKKSTIFVLSQHNYKERDKVSKGLLDLKVAVNNYFQVEGIISVKDYVSTKPPEFIPSNIEAVFKEGIACMSINCFNAAGTMFRLCIDLSTKGMLPKEEVEGLNQKIRRNLGLRLPWLFDNSILPESLRELSSCIKDDGNDGAHEGTLKKEDAEDMDFERNIDKNKYSIEARF